MISTKKITALLVLGCFLATQVFPARAFAEFWTKRGQAEKAAPYPENHPSSPLLLASLPQEFSSYVPKTYAGINSRQDKTQLPQELSTLIGKLKKKSVFVRDIYLPQNWDSSRPIVFYIEDIHENLIAQQNIAKTLKIIGKQKDPWLIGLEGARGDLTFKAYREVPFPSLLEEVGDVLLSHALISGAEYAALLNRSLTMVGVENPSTYLHNIIALKKAIQNETEMHDFLNARIRILQQQRKNVCSASLLSAVEQVESLKSGALPLAKFIFEAGEISSRYPQLQLFFKALTLEKQAKANSLFLEEYEKTLPLYQQVDSSLLARESEQFQEEWLLRKAHSGKEKEILKLTHDIELLNTLLSFRMNPRNWKNYQENRASILSALKNPIFTQANAPISTQKFVENLAFYEDFVRIALERDYYLSSNLLRAMAEKKYSRAVLVSGGFHSNGATEVLKQSGCAYAVLTPQIPISEINPNADYIDTFRRNNPALERFFLGTRLTLKSEIALADQPINIDDATILAVRGLFPILLTLSAGIRVQGLDVKSESLFDKDGKVVNDAATLDTEIRNWVKENKLGDDFKITFNSPMILGSSSAELSWTTLQGKEIKLLAEFSQQPFEDNKDQIFYTQMGKYYLRLLKHPKNANGSRKIKSHLRIPHFSRDNNSWKHILSSFLENLKNLELPGLALQPFSLRYSQKFAKSLSDNVQKEARKNTDFAFKQGLLKTLSQFFGSFFHMKEFRKFSIRYFGNYIQDSDLRNLSNKQLIEDAFSVRSASLFVGDPLTVEADLKDYAQENKIKYSLIRSNNWTKLSSKDNEESSLDLQIKQAEQYPDIQHAVIVHLAGLPAKELMTLQTLLSDFRYADLEDGTSKPLPSNVKIIFIEEKGKHRQDDPFYDRMVLVNYEEESKMDSFKINYPKEYDLKFVKEENQYYLQLTQDAKVLLDRKLARELGLQGASSKKLSVKDLQIIYEKTGLLLTVSAYPLLYALQKTLEEQKRRQQVVPILLNSEENDSTWIQTVATGFDLLRGKTSTFELSLEDETSPVEIIGGPNKNLSWKTNTPFRDALNNGSSVFMANAPKVYGETGDRIWLNWLEQFAGSRFEDKEAQVSPEQDLRRLGRRTPPPIKINEDSLFIVQGNFRFVTIPSLLEKQSITVPVRPFLRFTEKFKEKEIAQIEIALELLNPNLNSEASQKIAAVFWQVGNLKISKDIAPRSRISLGLNDLIHIAQGLKNGAPVDTVLQDLLVHCWTDEKDREAIIDLIYLEPKDSHQPTPLQEFIERYGHSIYYLPPGISNSDVLATLEEGKIAGTINITAGTTFDNLLGEVIPQEGANLEKILEGPLLQAIRESKNFDTEKILVIQNAQLLSPANLDKLYKLSLKEFIQMGNTRLRNPFSKLKLLLLTSSEIEQAPWPFYATAVETNNLWNKLKNILPVLESLSIQSVLEALQFGPEEDFHSEGLSGMSQGLAFSYIWKNNAVYLRLHNGHEVKTEWSLPEQKKRQLKENAPINFADLETDYGISNSNWLLPSNEHNRVFTETVTHLSRGRPVLLEGDPAGGKTTIAEEIARALGLRSHVVELAGLSEADLWGGLDLDQELREGILIDYIKNGGAIIIDESAVSRESLKTLISLLQLLDKDAKEASIPVLGHVQKVEIHKDFHLIFTSNRKGQTKGRLGFPKEFFTYLEKVSVGRDDSPQVLEPLFAYFMQDPQNPRYLQLGNKIAGLHKQFRENFDFSKRDLRSAAKLTKHLVDENHEDLNAAFMQALEIIYLGKVQEPELKPELEKALSEIKKNLNLAEEKNDFDQTPGAVVVQNSKELLLAGTHVLVKGENGVRFTDIVTEIASELNATIETIFPSKEQETFHLLGAAVPSEEKKDALLTFHLGSLMRHFTQDPNYNLDRPVLLYIPGPQHWEEGVRAALSGFLENGYVNMMVDGAMRRYYKPKNLFLISSLHTSAPNKDEISDAYLSRWTILYAPKDSEGEIKKILQQKYEISEEHAEKLVTLYRNLQDMDRNGTWDDYKENFYKFNAGDIYHTAKAVQSLKRQGLSAHLKNEEKEKVAIKIASHLILASRLSPRDNKKFKEVLKNIFGSDFYDLNINLRTEDRQITHIGDLVVPIYGEQRIDSGYSLSSSVKRMLMFLILCEQIGHGAILFGPPGSSKSSGARTYAQLTGRENTEDFFHHSISKDSSILDLDYKPALDEDQLVVRKGFLTSNSNIQKIITYDEINTGSHIASILPRPGLEYRSNFPGKDRLSMHFAIATMNMKGNAREESVPYTLQQETEMIPFYAQSPNNAQHKNVIGQILDTTSSLIGVLTHPPTMDKKIEISVSRSSSNENGNEDVGQNKRNWKLWSIAATAVIIIIAFSLTLYFIPDILGDAQTPPQGESNQDLSDKRSDTLIFDRVPIRNVATFSIAVIVSFIFLGVWAYFYYSYYQKKNSWLPKFNVDRNDETNAVGVELKPDWIRNDYLYPEAKTFLVDKDAEEITLPVFAPASILISLEIVDKRTQIPYSIEKVGQEYRVYSNGKKFKKGMQLTFQYAIEKRFESGIESIPQEHLKLKSFLKDLQKKYPRENAVTALKKIKKEISEYDSSFLPNLVFDGKEVYLTLEVKGHGWIKIIPLTKNGRQIYLSRLQRPNATTKILFGNYLRLWFALSFCGIGMALFMTTQIAIMLGFYALAIVLFHFSINYVDRYTSKKIQQKPESFNRFLQTSRAAKVFLVFTLGVLFYAILVAVFSAEGINRAIYHTFMDDPNDINYAREKTPIWIFLVVPTLASLFFEVTQWFLLKNFYGKQRKGHYQPIKFYREFFEEFFENSKNKKTVSVYAEEGPKIDPTRWALKARDPFRKERTIDINPHAGYEAELWLAYNKFFELVRLGKIKEAYKISETYPKLLTARNIEGKTIDDFKSQRRAISFFHKDKPKVLAQFSSWPAEWKILYPAILLFIETLALFLPIAEAIGNLRIQKKGYQNRAHKKKIANNFVAWFVSQHTDYSDEQKKELEEFTKTSVANFFEGYQPEAPASLSNQLMIAVVEHLKQNRIVCPPEKFLRQLREFTRDGISLNDVLKSIKFDPNNELHHSSSLESMRFASAKNLSLLSTQSLKKEQVYDKKLILTSVLFALCCLVYWTTFFLLYEDQQSLQFTILIITYTLVQGVALIKLIYPALEANAQRQKLVELDWYQQDYLTQEQRDAEIQRLAEKFSGQSVPEKHPAYSSVGERQLFGQSSRGNSSGSLTPRSSSKLPLPKFNMQRTFTLSQ